MLLLIVELVAVGLIVLGLYSLRGYFGLTLLFIFVAANQFLQNLLASTVYFEIWDRFPVSPGSAVLFSSSLLALLLVYMQEDIRTTRRLIYGILLANLSLLLVVWTTRWAVLTGRLQEVSAAADWFRHHDLRAFAIGTVLLMVDAVLLVVVYESVRARLRWLPMGVRSVLSLCLVLGLDGVAFVLLAFGGRPEMGDLLIGGLIGKLLAGSIYGTMLWGYVRFVGDVTHESEREVRDPFSILTYRERYERVLAEQRELERVRGREAEMVQAELARLESRYRALFEQAPLMDVLTSHRDLVPSIEDCNLAFLEALGYQREEVVGRPLGDFYTEASRVELMSERGYRHTLMHGLNAVERQLVTKQGDVVETILTAVPERGPDGEAIGSRAMYVDITQRKRAEDALRKSESQLAEAQRVAGIGRWELDLGTNKLHWSEEVFRIFGLRPQRQEIDYAEFMARVHPADRERVQRSNRATRNAERDQDMDHRILLPDGSERVVHERAQVHFDDEGQPIRIVGTVHDITERKHAEEALRKSEARLAAAQRVAQIGSWEFDPAANETTWSDEHFRIFGVDRREFSPSYESHIELVHHEDRPLVRRVYVEAQASGEPFSFDHRIVRPGGGTRVIHAEGRWETDPYGGGRRLHGTVQDVTERKLAENALKRSETSLAEAQRLARLGNWESDLVTGRDYWSAAMYELLQLDPDEFTPTFEVFLDFVHPADRGLIKQRVKTILSDHEPYAIEHRVSRPDGTIRTWHAEVRLDTDPQGTPVRLHGTSQDITERKETERTLQRSRRQLRRLAAKLEAVREEERTMIAREIHDELGQALTGLKMYLSGIGNDIAAGTLPLPSRIASIADLLDQTIDTVRDLSARLRPAVLDDLGLQAAIEWLTTDFSRRSGIDCRAAISDQEADIDADRATAVFRILQEALTNVARHAKATRVDVVLRQVDSQLVLAVSDDGMGIDPNEFWRETSLGFLGMRERAAGHDGVVDVSRGETGGTTVSLMIPL